MKKKLETGATYKPNYNIKKIAIVRNIKDSGEDIEIIGFYMVDEHIYHSVPDYKEVIDKILPIIKGTGISKISIIMLNDNLEKKL